MQFILLPFRILLSAVRMITFLIGTVLIVSVHLVWMRLTDSIALAHIWHAFCCWNFGTHVHIIGSPAQGPGRTVLFVPNHLSYVDIGVMGSLPNTIFVAKSEVRGWPFMGWLTSKQKTIYIRRIRTAMQTALDDINARIAQGYNIILFPEGTSGDGAVVLPFKPGLFELAYAHSPHGRMLVQPIAIVFESIEGRPVKTQKDRDHYAWWRKEDTLLPHMLQLGMTLYRDVSVYYLDSLDPVDYPARKDLALAAENAVRAIVEKHNE